MTAGLSFLTSISRDGEDAVLGRLGVLLMDESSGDVIALTAAQVARGSVAIFAEGRRIGVTSTDVDRTHDGASERPAYTLIELVKLDADMLLARPSAFASRLDGGTSFALDPEPTGCAGGIVLVHGGGTRPREGLLRSMHAPFRMPAPDSDELTLFRDALMVSSLDGEPLSLDGDAGALVTTAEGLCLGVVIAGTGGTSFVAPIAPVLRRDNALRPIDDDDTHVWNMAAQLRRLAPKSTVELASPMAPIVTPRLSDLNWQEDPKDMVVAGQRLADASL